MGWGRRELCDRLPVGEEPAELTVSKERVPVACLQTEPFAVASDAIDNEFEWVLLNFVRAPIPSDKTTGHLGNVLDELIKRQPDRVRFYQYRADLVARDLARREQCISAG